MNNIVDWLAQGLMLWIYLHKNGLLKIIDLQQSAIF